MTKLQHFLVTPDTPLHRDLMDNLESTSRWKEANAKMATFLGIDAIHHFYKDPYTFCISKETFENNPSIQHLFRFDRSLQRHVIKLSSDRGKEVQSFFKNIVSEHRLYTPSLSTIWINYGLQPLRGSGNHKQVKRVFDEGNMIVQWRGPREVPEYMRQQGQFLEPDDEIHKRLNQATA